MRAERERDDSDNKQEMLCKVVREEERRFRMMKAVRDEWRRSVFLKSEVGGLCLC